MIDGVPTVAEFVASGLAVAEKDSQGRTVMRTDPEVHRQINAALAERGRAAAERNRVARDRNTGRQLQAILCGGDPSEHDREVVRAFAAALELDDESERRRAVLELQDRGVR
jgi:hypothetical protein